MDLTLEYIKRTWFYVLVIAFFSVTYETSSQTAYQMLYSLATAIAWFYYSLETVKYLQKKLYGFWIG